MYTLISSIILYVCTHQCMFDNIAGGSYTKQNFDNLMKTAFTRCEDISKERFYHWTTTATATRTSKRTIGLLSKTTTLYVHHTFLYISLPSLHDYDVKCLISRFMEDVNKRWLIFLSLSKRKCGPEKINSRVRSSPTLFWHFQRIGLNATVFEKTRIHFKSEVLASVAVNDAKAP